MLPLFLLAPICGADNLVPDSTLRVYPKMICSGSSAGMAKCMDTLSMYVAFRYIEAHQDFYAPIAEKISASKAGSKSLTKDQERVFKIEQAYFLAKPVAEHWDKHGALPEDPIGLLPTDYQ